MTYLESHKECPKCGSNHKGKPFCVYEDGYHCFSCGHTKRSDRSFAIREPRTQNKFLWEAGSVAQAAKFSLKNKLWLSKYYVFDDEIHKYNIQESVDGALLFPNANGEEHYQKRYIQDNRLILSHGVKTPSHIKTGKDTVVLVEDFISHIRIAEFLDSVCLWGTKAPYDFLKQLLNYTKILVWLDNDSAKQTNSGQEAAKKICQTLNTMLNYKKRRYAYGNIMISEVKIITTDQDPKCYSPTEIKRILGAWK